MELVSLCQETKVAWEARGGVDYEQKESEKGNVQFRRSLYLVKDIKAGETLSAEHIRSIRPGYGLSALYV